MAADVVKYRAQRMIRANMHNENSLAGLQLIRQYDLMLLTLDRKQGEVGHQNQRQQAMQVRKIRVQLEQFYTEKYLTEKDNIDSEIRSELMFLLNDRIDRLQRNPFILLANRFRYLVHQRKMIKIAPGKLQQIQLQELDLNLYVARAIEDRKNKGL